MSVNSKMTAIADAIRAKTGGTGLLTLDDMAQNIATIDTSENLDTVLAEQDELITDIQTALEGKGVKPEQTKTVTPQAAAQTVTPDSGYTLSSVTVNAVPTQTKTVTPSASVQNITPDDGKFLSEVTVNAMPSEDLSAELAEYTALNAELEEVIDSLPDEGSGGKPEQTKTVTPSAAAQTVTPDSGYTLSSVTVSAVPTQTKTATPSASSQNITPDSGKFLSKVTVNGDSNLIAGNIKSGVSIFGVAGSYEGSGGGSGGGGMETCTVTITQEWGMNDDPELLRLFTPYYNILANGSVEYGFVELTSRNDYEPSHSVAFTALKHIPIMILAEGFGTTIRCTATGQGGVIEELVERLRNEGYTIYRCIPTADTAVFTVATP